MDNQLTPSKIECLLNIAQGCPTQLQGFLRRDILSRLDQRQLESLTSIVASHSATQEESSASALDLDQCVGLGDTGSFSINKSGAFNTAELTGRSTSTDDSRVSKIMSELKAIQDLDKAGSGRFSWSASAVEDMVQKMNKQTSDINDIMRNSIASGYSLHSHRDLSADEASFVAKQVAMPVPQSEMNLNLTKIIDPKEMSGISSVSVGAYFQNRCSEFSDILPRAESPQYDISMNSNMPDDQSSINQSEPVIKNPSSTLDFSLDCVPVRQPRQSKPSLIPTFQKTPQSTLPSITETDVQRAINTATLKFTSDTVPKKTVDTVSAMSVNLPKKPASNATKAIYADPFKQHLTLQNITEESSHEDASFSISTIANYLGNESEIRPSIFMKHLKDDKKQTARKEPLGEIDSNIIEALQAIKDLHINKDDFVVNLKDTERADTACSTATANTVISVDKNKSNKENINEYNIPEVIISRHSNNKNELERLSLKSNFSSSTKTKSPISRSSKSTCSTVQENLVSTSFRSGDSPLHARKSEGEQNVSHVRSPNIQYRELDKSVDWQEVLHQKKYMRDGLAKDSISEDWAKISVEPVIGFVGVCAETKVIVTTQTDSWLTAQLVFASKPNDKDILIELPRFPVLLSPKKPEQFIVRLTPNVVVKSILKFTLKLKDASIDLEIEQSGEINVDFKLPPLQTVTKDGINSPVIFTPMQEGGVMKKPVILISDCPSDLLLDLTIFEGNTLFSISHVQEIKKSDLQKCLTENYPSADNLKHSRHKMKPTNRQSCRLGAGNAIRVLVTFIAPTLSDLQLEGKQAKFNGSLSVFIIGTSTLLRKIDLTATVGTAELDIKVTSKKIHISDEPSVVKLINNGTITGAWLVKFRQNVAQSCPFKVSCDNIEINPGAMASVTIEYLGPQHEYNESTLIFEDVINQKETSVLVSGGKTMPKLFPIKTTLGEMSWVRDGRKEISLKNCSDRKVNIKCKIVGNGFIMDTPKASGTDLLLTFAPSECKAISIIFEPTSMMPHKAKLMILNENELETGKSVRLHGAACGGWPRWSGLVTYGDAALVRAEFRQPVVLALYNRSSMPAFISARVNFNLQYLDAGCAPALAGARAVTGGRRTWRVTLGVRWARVERAARASAAGNGAASTLATLSVLVGAELTRQRILKILREESNGNIDESKLSDHLRRLVGQFEGEDPALNASIQDFQESKKSLESLLSGIQELSAQIELPLDFAEHTICLTDDTMLDHHTLCD